MRPDPTARGEGRDDLDRLVSEIARDFLEGRTGSIDECVDSAIARIGRHVRADRSYVFVYSDDGAAMTNSHEWCADGIEPQIHNLQELPRGLFSWHDEQFESEPVIDIRDVAAMPDDAAVEREVLIEQDIRSVLMFRMTTPERGRIGFVGFDAVRSLRPWSDDDVYLLGVVAGIIAAVLERERMTRELVVHQRRLRRLASQLTMTEEQQRRSLAMQLHDGVGQDLAVVRLRLRALQESGAPAQADTLSEILGILDDAIARSQDLTFDLSPPALYEIGLLPALEALARRMTGGDGPSVDVAVRGEPRDVSEAHRVMLFRVCRELVTNAIKHGGTERIEVTLRFDPVTVGIEVRDDGPGFEDPGVATGPQDGTEGFGLFSIRERINALGGSITVGSGPGAWVTVTLPIDGNGNGGDGNL